MSTQWYVTQSGIGSQNGSLANPWAVTGYNGSTTTTQPGDVVNLSGVITGQIIPPNGGAPNNPITIYFMPGANMSAPVWSTSAGGAINLFQKNYIVIDGGGGSGMGGPNGNSGLANGTNIQCTANGTNLANSLDAVGINANSCAYLTVKNLTIGPIYARTGVLDIIPGASSNACVLNNAANISIPGFTVTNCILHDAFDGIDSDYGLTGGYTFSYNTIYNCNWGGRCGDRNATSVMTGLVVHDNLIFNFTNWNQTGDQYHHNGFYAWAENLGSLVNPIFYNNVIGPGFGGSFQTAGIFVSCSNGLITGATFYNNLFVCNPGEFVGNNLITVGGNGLMGTVNFWNNTFFMGGSGTAFGATSNAGNAINGVTGSYTVNAFNNLGFSGSTFITAVKTGSATNNINYNLGYGFSPTNAYEYTTGYNGGNGVYYSYAQWTGFGFDLNSPTGNPILTPNYHLTAGSPAIQSGTNLSSFFTFDAANNPRPGFGNWDIGAYQYLIYRLKRLGAHLKMYGYSL